MYEGAKKCMKNDDNQIMMRLGYKSMNTICMHLANKIVSQCMRDSLHALNANEKYDESVQL